MPRRDPAELLHHLTMKIGRAVKGDLNIGKGVPLTTTMARDALSEGC